MSGQCLHSSQPICLSTRNLQDRSWRQQKRGAFQSENVIRRAISFRHSSERRSKDMALLGRGRDSSQLIVHDATAFFSGPDATSALDSLREKDTTSAGGCSGAATIVHWLPVGTGIRPEFCRQACASSDVDISFLAVGSCDDAGFHTFLGSHSRAGAPGFEGSVEVSDFTSRRSMF